MGILWQVSHDNDAGALLSGHKKRFQAFVLLYKCMNGQGLDLSCNLLI